MSKKIIAFLHKKAKKVVAYSLYAIFWKKSTVFIKFMKSQDFSLRYTVIPTERRRGAVCQRSLRSVYD